MFERRRAVVGIAPGPAAVPAAAPIDAQGEAINHSMLMAIGMTTNHRMASQIKVKMMSRRSSMARSMERRLA